MDDQGITEIDNKTVENYEEELKNVVGDEIFKSSYYIRKLDMYTARSKSILQDFNEGKLNKEDSIKEIKDIISSYLELIKNIKNQKVIIQKQIGFNWKSFSVYLNNKSEQYAEASDVIQKKDENKAILSTLIEYEKSSINGYLDLLEIMKEINLADEDIYKIKLSKDLELFHLVYLIRGLEKKGWFEKLTNRDIVYSFGKYNGTSFSVDGIKKIILKNVPNDTDFFDSLPGPSSLKMEFELYKKNKISNNQ
ncbi:MAG: hypothetical protein A2015_07065 [Spirochaetes bacterium GWF1_31_7]|nr:MAG: hypothetical protein A2Y29_00620 [Spirochaetes bacterium GWE2_31_10]OHD48573.1 MAG: hypothetical protein A2015_07065 [Spirochaetes bacterium GWF1_31_7]OHD76371.1 MAG: hypothetical protein A2355_14780 [Spirochaetes bacterium RIFOXYB1_FULL_32_8]HBD94714.1 hypothetical protein [Spirochaetia bacterium]HBI39042.1 hypothetical protein [Spirochaetia bacterium]